MASRNRRPRELEDEQVQKPYELNSVSDDDIDTLLSSRLIDANVFLVFMLVLVAIILWSGLNTATKIQEYRQDYKTLQQLKLNHRNLQVEHQRLLIEQQTFSSTPKITSRAVTELNMHFPAFKNKIILQPKSNKQTFTNIHLDNLGQIQGDSSRADNTRIDNTSYAEGNQ